VSRREFFVGLDLGQAQDFTALAAIERVAETGWDKREYHVRHLMRWPLGTPYTQLVHEVKQLLAEAPLRGACRLVIDATGVGIAVVDLFRQGRLGAEMVGVSITAGAEVRELDGGDCRVPKKDLVGVIAVLLQQRRLKIAPALHSAQILVQELREFRVKVSESGRDSYGVWREGVHDDLVLAVALASWYAEHIGGSGSRLVYIGGQIIDLDDGVVIQSDQL
jgi:hypothetical protein